MILDRFGLLPAFRPRGWGSRGRRFKFCRPDIGKGTFIARDACPLFFCRCASVLRNLRDGDGAVGISGWERALIAGEQVRERLRRATQALDRAGVCYAVVGGNAVAEWVGRVDEDAVRTTRDVDLLIRRADLPAARAALEAVGFVYHHRHDVDTFSDGPEGRPSGGIHLVFAGEKLRPGDVNSSPELDESERAAEFQVATLEALVRMNLDAWRDEGRTHLRDMIGVGLVDRTWPARFHATLGERLRQLLDHPNG